MQTPTTGAGGKKALDFLNEHPAVLGSSVGEIRYFNMAAPSKVCFANYSPFADLSEKKPFADMHYDDFDL